MLGLVVKSDGALTRFTTPKPLKISAYAFIQVARGYARLPRVDKRVDTFVPLTGLWSPVKLGITWARACEDS